MFSYSPRKNNVDQKTLYENFFNKDLLDPNFFKVFKKELFDFFALNPDKMFDYPEYWLLNVYGTWYYFDRFAGPEILAFTPLKVLAGAGFGFDVYDKLMWYMKLNFVSPSVREIFYEGFRKAFMESEEGIGIGENRVIAKDIYKEIGFKAIKGEDNPDLKIPLKKLEKALFENKVVKDVEKYIFTDRKIALNGLVKIFKLFYQTGPKEIWDKTEKFVFSQTEGFEPTGKAEKLIESPVEIEDLEKVVKNDILLKTDTLRKNEKKAETEKEFQKENKPKPEIVPKIIAKPIVEEKTEAAVAPSYSEIKAKILQFFPKDETGEIIDTEGVYEVLEKTADKYNDEKIKELYYYNEESGKFEWSV